MINRKISTFKIWVSFMLGKCNEYLISFVFRTFGACGLQILILFELKINRIRNKSANVVDHGFRLKSYMRFCVFAC